MSPQRVLALTLAFPLHAMAAAPPKPLVKIEPSPANYVGKPVDCGAQFPATPTLGKAFHHVFNNTCYSCPPGYNRTINPDVNAPTACELPPQRQISRTTRHARATGLLRTDCPRGSGQFLHIPDGYCYSCPSGYNRTTSGIGANDACARGLPAKSSKATLRGNAGCPKGSFQNGLLLQCYTCPPGYARSISIGADLTKLRDACVRVTVNLPPVNIGIPADIGARALREVQKFTRLIDLSSRTLPKHAAAYASHGKLEAIRDPQIEAEAKRQLFKTMSVGIGGDGSSPYVVGGSGSVEVSHSLERWSGFKKTATVSVTATPPGFWGASGSLQFTFLTDDFDSFEGWALIVNLGGGPKSKPWGGGVSAAFGIEFVPVVRFLFLGFTVAPSAGVSAMPVDVSAGVAYQFPI